MLHLSEDGVALAGGAEDNAYPIPRTPREQTEYDQVHLERARAHEDEQANEHHDDKFPSPQHLDVEGMQA